MNRAVMIDNLATKPEVSAWLVRPGSARHRAPANTTAGDPGHGCRPPYPHLARNPAVLSSPHQGSDAIPIVATESVTVVPLHPEVMTVDTARSEGRIYPPTLSVSAANKRTESVAPPCSTTETGIP